MIVHHTNKNDGFNGTQAFRNHVDAIIELHKEDKNDKNSPIVLTCEKARDDEPFGDIRTELKSVQIGFNEEAQATITSCVAVMCETEERPKNKLSDTEQNILDLLGDQHLPANEWLKECEKELKIKSATFYRAIKKLQNENIVKKCKILGKKIEGYKAIKTEKNGINIPLQGGGDSH